MNTYEYFELDLDNKAYTEEKKVTLIRKKFLINQIKDGSMKVVGETAISKCSSPDKCKHDAHIRVEDTYFAVKMKQDDKTSYPFYVSVSNNECIGYKKQGLLSIVILFIIVAMLGSAIYYLYYEYVYQEPLIDTIPYDGSYGSIYGEDSNGDEVIVKNILIPPINNMNTSIDGYTIQLSNPSENNVSLMYVVCEVVDKKEYTFISTEEAADFFNNNNSVSGLLFGNTEHVKGNSLTKTKYVDNTNLKVEYESLVVVDCTSEIKPGDSIEFDCSSLMLGSHTMVAIVLSNDENKYRTTVDFNILIE